MDLGIAGRSAIICASSKGLGKACALALARAGCNVVVNGRDAARAEATAQEIRTATGADVRVVAGDVGDPAIREALLAACPAPDILVNNNGGPPPTPFEAISREILLAGDRGQHADADRADPGGGAGHGGAKIRPYRQHHLGLGAGADRRLRCVLGRPRGTHRLPRQRRAQICARQCDDQFDPAGDVLDRPGAAAPRAPIPKSLRSARRAIPAGRFGEPDEFGALCAFLCSADAGYIAGQNILIDGGAFPGAF